MTDNTTPDTSSAPSADENVPAAVEEPKQASAKPAGAKPAKRKIAHDAVVGGGDTDPVLYSKARMPGPRENRKSLTVLHIQRRLADEGYSEANSAPGGRYEALTLSAVRKYQIDQGADATGILTRDQFAALFEGDPNVDVQIDTHFDHTL